MPEESPRHLNLVKHLPQRRENWFVSVRQPRIFSVEEDGSIIHPCLTLIFGLDDEIIYNHDMKETVPDALELSEMLIKTMRRPMKEIRLPPHRPSKIFFEKSELAEALRPVLDEIGIETGIQDPPEIVKQLIADMEEQYGDESERLGLLNIEGVTPQLLSELFKAAANYYRAGPWIYLSDEQPLAFQLSQPDRSGYAELLGNAGYEYGLLLYWKWEDLVGIFLGSGDPLASIPESGWISLTFGPATLMTFDDLDAIQTYGLEIADPQAYPLLVVFQSDESVGLPDAETLQTYIALLQAIPFFVEQLQITPDGDYYPGTFVQPVTVNSTVCQMSLAYPAGELRREALPARLDFHQDDDLNSEDEELEILDDEFDLYEEEDGSDEGFDIDILDIQRAMEGEIAQQTGELASAYPDPGLRQAQELMYSAWKEPDSVERAKLARQALEISPDCADAYVMLAEELAVNLGQALKFYERGKQAGERALGKEYFEQHAGEFWTRLETRPYMRACDGMADTLSDLHRHDQAFALWNEMLRLNPDDNQGVRYRLLSELVNYQKNEEAEQLTERYLDDDSASWRYNQALLAYRRDGATDEARTKLVAATKINKYVPNYLTERKRLPIDNLDYFSPGDENEAIDYAVGNLNAWRITPGAMDWLRSVIKSEEKSARAARYQAGQAKPHPQKSKKRRH